MNKFSNVFAFLFGFAISVSQCLADEATIFADQGALWTKENRSEFYTRDQGARLIPFSWLEALPGPDGQPFLNDGLTRYGYLPNPTATNGLPIGFHASGATGVKIVGMTCAACHTRQIKVDGKSYRIDGGPAITDFQSLMVDLDAAVGRVLNSDEAFKAFAKTALDTPSPTAADVASLRSDVEAWHRRFHTLMSRALPTPPWGLGRLDAVGMIFNRLSGLDVGPDPDRIIPDNIHVADAPVRYPFIWNAPIQDKTQWPGFANNGSEILGMARNVGEVIGVFANFQPEREGSIVNFLHNSSVNFDGIARLEELVRSLGAPKWPWTLNGKLVAEGKSIFDRPTASGGCVECHSIRTGERRSLFSSTWATPIQNVGTDTREHDVLGWKAKTGVLKDIFIPGATQPLKDTDLVLNMLATSVIGSIAEHVVISGGFSTKPQITSEFQASSQDRATKPSPLPPSLKDLNCAFILPGASGKRTDGAAPQDVETGTETPLTEGAYEARVLEGIWATAPYLHNGSVPTLKELLRPAAQRATVFAVGPDYDLDEVGLAKNQATGSKRYLTGCSDLNSGNSNCGHEFGTALSDGEKQALLEYLKSL